MDSDREFVGRFQQHDGIRFYSPNSPIISSLSLEELPTGENPFQPQRGRKSDVRYADVLRPRPWEKPFYWMAFIPTEHWYKTYNLPPIRTLSVLPTIHYSTEPSKQGFHINANDPFRLFEDDIYRAIAALRNKFNLPCVLPFLPKTLGYLDFYNKKSQLLHALEEAREWFSVWLGALSYCLVMAQTRREDTEKLKFGYPEYRQVLKDAGLSEGWIDDIVRSPVGQLIPERPRVGCVLKLIGRHPEQPSPDWWITNGIPIWYKWGKEEEEWVKLHTLPFWEPQRISAIPATTIVDEDRAEEAPGKPEWVEVFEGREARYPHMMATESAIARQRRESRIRDPPIRSAPVFEWWPKSDNHVEWERAPVSAKFRTEALRKYAKHQRRYDPFFNEWDCCDEFDFENGYALDGDTDDDDDDDDDDWRRAKPTLPVPEATPACVATSEHQAAFDPAPDLFRPPSPHANQSSTTESPPSAESPFNPIRADVEEVFGKYYGFCAPVPGTKFRDIPTTQCSNDAFLRLLGVVSEDVIADPYFSSSHHNTVRRFLDSMIGIKPGASFLSDLDDSSLSPVRLLPRFKNIVQLDLRGRPRNSEYLDNGDLLYVFNFPQARVPWKLATFSPVTALFICRLLPEYTETSLVFHLVQRGIPFRVLHPPPHIRKPLTAPIKLTLPIRPWDHQFTNEDYESYLHNRTMILGQPHMQAALRRGGLIWRLAIGVMGFSDITRQPTLWGETFSPAANLIEDTASTMELDLICGAYECITVDGKKLALKSWWPLVRYYEKPECGENHGHWSDRREFWYQERLSAISTSNAQPLSYTDWKTRQHGVKAVRHFLKHISKSSANLIATHSSATL